MPRSFLLFFTTWFAIFYYTWETRVQWLFVRTTIFYLVSLLLDISKHIVGLQHLDPVRHSRLYENNFVVCIDAWCVHREEIHLITPLATSRTIMQMWIITCRIDILRGFVGVHASTYTRHHSRWARYWVESSKLKATFDRKKTMFDDECGSWPTDPTRMRATNVTQVIVLLLLMSSLVTWKRSSPVTLAGSR